MTNYRITSPSENTKRLLAHSFEVAALKLGIATPNWLAVLEDPSGHIGLPIKMRGCTWPDSAGCVKVLINLDQSDEKLIETIFHETKHMAMLERDYGRGQITDRAIGEGAANFFARTEAPTGSRAEIMDQLYRTAIALKSKALSELVKQKRVPSPTRAVVPDKRQPSRYQKRRVQFFDVDRREWRFYQV